MSHSFNPFQSGVLACSSQLRFNVSRERPRPFARAIKPSFIAISLATFVLLAAAPIQGQQVRKVALSGESPFGISDADLYRGFANTPVIDNMGQVGFSALLGLEASTSSVWIASHDELRIVARSGDPAPATGAAFAQFSDVRIADGIIAFKARLVGAAIDGPYHDSIWLDRFGSLSLITQTGQKAPSPTVDLRFSHIETPIALDRSGEIAFFARTRNKEDSNTQSSGLWTASSTRVAFAADAQSENLHGLPGVVFSPQSFEQPFANNPTISPMGETVFRGFLVGSGVDESNLNGLWSYSDKSGLRLLQRAGDEAVGMEGARFVSFPSIPTINAAGDLAFLAFVEKPHESPDVSSVPQVGLNEDDHEHGLGLWLRHASGALDPVFALGDDAPDIGPEVHFVDVFDPVMNALSRIALLAVVAGDGVNGANEIGLWSSGMSPDGRLKLVARQGNESPGSHDFVFGTFLEPSLNAAGQTAFMASGYQLENGIIVDSAFGIWGQDRAGVLQLVARVGQDLAVGPSDNRKISSLSFVSMSGGEDGRGRGLNDLGQVVFHATFTDGSSGIFVSNALAVPEVSTWTLLTVAGTSLATGIRLKRHKDI